ncbi:MAG: amidase [Alphaproteobacteria bacterium]
MTKIFHDPCRLTAREAAQALQSDELSPGELLDACLRRIAAREPTVRAWATLDPTQAAERARELDGMAPARRGGLFGLPLGIKDIIDTADFPTQFGSPVFAGRRPPKDAPVVARALRAGAILPGKTVTTELATFHPADTANPHNPAHTPGGSSSGSAAAVADFHVPLALGTQTVGSVVRPASFCGIVGFKPSHGWVSLKGVNPLSVSFDTVGLMARDVSDIWLLWASLSGKSRVRAMTPVVAERPRVAFCRTPDWPKAEPAMQALVLQTARDLQAAGVEVDEIEFGEDFSGLHAAHQTVMAFEAARDLGYIRTKDGDRISPLLGALLAEGDVIPKGEYAEALDLLRRCRDFTATLWAKYGLDLLLAPAAPGEAPHGLGSTGDARFNRLWSYLGLPCASLPRGRGPNGLPLGIQLVGAAGKDAAFLANLEGVWRALDLSPLR